MTDAEVLRHVRPMVMVLDEVGTILQVAGSSLATLGYDPETTTLEQLSFDEKVGLLEGAVSSGVGRRLEREQRFFLCGRLVNLLQISRDNLVVFPRHVLQRVAYHVDNAELNLGLRESGVDRVRKTFKTINTGD